MFPKLFWLAVAGACGTLARYGLAGVAHRWWGSAFPWGTTLVNLCGCLLFGVLWALAAERGLLSAEVRTIVLVGFLGALTTFSTLIAETGLLLAETQLLIGFLNLTVQLVAGLGVFYLGLAMGRVL